MRSCVAALGLLAVAASILVVIHPGGFESQIAWFFGLMPGAFAGAVVGDRLYEMNPWLDRIVYWPVFLGVSFLWYLVISFLAIKVYRSLRRTSHHESCPCCDDLRPTFPG